MSEAALLDLGTVSDETKGGPGYDFEVCTGQFIHQYMILDPGWCPLWRLSS